MAEYEMVAELCHEHRMYRLLSTLQGEVVPVCYGLFFLRPTCAVLLTEDCGESLESFVVLSELQRHELFFFPCEKKKELTLNEWNLLGGS